jgi:acetyl esterase/lipase
MVRFVVALLAVMAILPLRGGAFWPAFRIGRIGEVERLNRSLAGQLLDFTSNHGRDHRFYSPALGEKKGVYVYLPPGYDGVKQFPVMLWLHGANQDEKSFLTLAPHFDTAVRSGALPPLVIVAPDGSLRTRPSLIRSGSFFLNSKAGRYEDYIIRDLWPWALNTFAVRPERDAHVIAGASMGGGAAYNLAFKHKELFKNVVGIHPPLDLRWQDCTGNYFGDYRPDCVGVRDRFPPFKVVARFYGVLVVRQRRLIGPVAGRGLTAVRFIARESPIEMLDPYRVAPGEFDFFVGYGTKDDFNIDAEVEHFLDVAAARGIHPEVFKLEGGHHNTRDGVKMFPAFSRWLHPRLAPYAPGAVRVGEAPAESVRMIASPALPIVPAPPLRTLRER